MKTRRGVIGILERDGGYLMVRRAAGIVKAGFWCFPGGHVERGENARMAIQRELQEELGILSTPDYRMGSIRIEQPDYILAVWKMKNFSDTMVPNTSEVAEIRWVHLNEIATISPGLPSNLNVVEMLRSGGYPR